MFFFKLLNKPLGKMMLKSYLSENAKWEAKMRKETQKYWYVKLTQRLYTLQVKCFKTKFRIQCIFYRSFMPKEGQGR